ncbi:MAG: [LysW]-lysine hydrolase [Phycisphaeraceae bacterium]|nr:[LysW]-lysine hydrolase [Phycisphaeraceae bacterium]
MTPGMDHDRDVLMARPETACGCPIAESLQVEIDDQRAIDIVHRLVAVPSVSGCESDAVLTFVSAANELGLHAHIDQVGNGIAIRTGPSAAGPRREIVLLGHIDTVAGVIPVRIEHDVLFGRGSVDAKGPLAAMLVAAAVTELPPGIDVRVCAAVGEETPSSPGARHLATALRPAACIVGEPSGWDGVTLGYKGTLVLHAAAARANAHGAGPGESASDALHRWWQDVRRAVDEFNQGRAGVFDIIQATIRHMEACNDGLEESAAITAAFRLPPWMNPHRLEDSIRRRTPVMIHLLAEGHERAIRTDRSDLVAQCLSAAIRAEGGRPHPKVKTGTADMNVVAPIWRCPIAAYGPGDSELDHTPSERLSLAEYLRSIRVLRSALADLGSRLCEE